MRALNKLRVREAWGKTASPFWNTTLCGLAAAGMLICSCSLLMLTLTLTTLTTHTHTLTLTLWQSKIWVCGLCGPAVLVPKFKHSSDEGGGYTVSCAP